MKKTLSVMGVVACLSLIAGAQEIDARAYAAAHEQKGRATTNNIVPAAPHACTLDSCLYYAGDIPKVHPAVLLVSKGEAQRFSRFFVDGSLMRVLALPKSKKDEEIVIHIC